MAENPIATARDAGRATLTEPEAKALLDRAGFSTPAGRTASSPDSAAAAASDLGYPVTVKVSSPSVTHKRGWADGAGITLDCANENDVADAAADALEAADRAGIEADVYVERMVETSGVECVVGGIRRPAFGPTVLVGLGGTAVELFEDVSHRLAPVDETEIREMLTELQASELLDGYRGGPVADREALIDGVRTVGDLLVENESLHEVECNPLLVTADDAIALDALATLEDQS